MRFVFWSLIVVVVLLGPNKTRLDAQITRDGEKGFLDVEMLKPIGQQSILSMVKCGSSWIAGCNLDILRSDDDCQTWANMAMALPQRYIIGAARSGEAIIAIGGTGGSFLTQDEGLTWKKLPQAGSGHLHRLHSAKGAFYGLAADSGLYVSMDKGATWVPHSACTKHYRDFRVNDSGGWTLDDSLGVARWSPEWSMQGIDTIPAAVRNPLFGASSSWCGVVADSALFLVDTSGTIQRTVILPTKGWSTICLSETDVYLSRQRGSIVRVDIANGSVSDVPLGPMGTERVTALEWYKGGLYVGLREGVGGLHRLDPATNAWTRVHPSVMPSAAGQEITMLTVSADMLYAGSREDGLYELDTTTSIMKAMNETLGQVLAHQVVPFGKGFIIASRIKGLLSIDSCDASLKLFARNLPHGSEYSVAVMNDKLLVSIMNAGVLMSADSGRTWTRRSEPYEKAIINKLETRGKSIYACSVNGLWSTNDLGLTWVNEGAELAGEDVEWTVTNGKSTYAGTRTTTWLRTGNRPWKECRTHLIELGPDRFSTMSFVGKTVYGMANTTIYRSTNDGRTWSEMELVDVGPIRHSFVADGFLYITTDRGAVMRAPVH